MLKYAKVINEQTKECEVGLGTNVEFYTSIGMTEQNVEQAYNGGWYLQGHAPTKPQSVANAERVAELKQLLTDTDYQAIKYSEGWLTEEEYAPIKAQREAYREEIRELEN